MAERVGDALLRKVAASCDPLRFRARCLLGALRLVIPFDAAWLAEADPLGGSYTSLASLGLDRRVLDFLGGPVMAHDIRVTGGDRGQTPQSPSDLPYPVDRLRSWTDCLIPAGLHEAMAVSLYGADGRRVGFLTLLSSSDSPPTSVVRRRLEELAPVVARGIDPMPCLLTMARLVRHPTAGAVLRSDRRTEPLAGLVGDPLLAVDSPVITLAAARLADGQVYSSFLWPLGGRHAPGGHVQVTVIAAPGDLPRVVDGVVVLSTQPDLHTLTPRQLEVLGLVADGCSNQEIARTLGIASRTVAAHVEHLLHKLDAATRTLAAVRGERAGLCVPSMPPPGRRELRRRAVPAGR